MKVDMEQRRLKKIKLIRVHFIAKECKKCGNHYVHEKMWRVARWGINDAVYDWHYCTNCFKTKEEVLKEVDSDFCRFNIYPFEPHWGIANG